MTDEKKRKNDAAQEKFMEIYEKYCRLMKYVALKKVIDESLAEDVVQNAFIKIFRFIDKFPETDSPKTRAFVVLIVENCCKDILKTEKRQKNKLLKIFDKSENVKIESVGEYTVESKFLASQMDKIPQKNRTVLMLKAYYDLTDKEIAEMMGISAAAVRKRLERARKQAKEILLEGSKHE